MLVDLNPAWMGKTNDLDLFKIKDLFGKIKIRSRSVFVLFTKITSITNYQIMLEAWLEIRVVYQDTT